MKKNTSEVIGCLIMKYRNPIQIEDAYLEYERSKNVEKFTLEEFKAKFNSLKEKIERVIGRTLRE